MSKTVIQHVLSRLKELGIKDIFGVAGDYAFPIEDAVCADKDMRWVGSCNELNAAYSADGYARIHGDDVVLVVVNLDPFAVHEGVCVVPYELGLQEPFDLVDALTGETYSWGARNYVRLGPGRSHVLVPAR